MKDSAHLLLAGLVFSVAAWAIWHFTAEDGFEIISTLALIAVIADNFRLRRALRDKMGP